MARKRKTERIVKTKVNWKKRSQVNRLHLVMIFLLIAICISVAAGIILAIIQIYDPFSEPEVVSSMPEVVSSEEEEALPVYDNSFNLVLANSTEALPENYLIQITEFHGVSLDKRIVPALEKMIEAAAQDGVTLTVVSGYRSSEKQDAEFERRVEELMANGSTRVRAEASVQSSFGRGGYNESQTGLTVGFATDEEPFSSSEASRWLTKNSILYGFILRFPQGSEETTGREYDPSQYRYVGIQNAEKMRQLSMCLEEYAEYLNEQQGG